MGHKNAKIHYVLGYLTVFAEEADAVHDVYWQPTHGKEEDYQGQGFCQFQLPAIVPLPISRGFGTSVELSSDQPEHFRIQSNHDGQGCHHPTKEVEVHHVVHSDDRGKLTNDFTGNAQVFLRVVIIPSSHRNQSGQEGHRPTETHCHVCPPRCHYGAVPGQDKDGFLSFNACCCFYDIT